ncbi:flavodoxin family protein [Clostridioides difficile]
MKITILYQTRSGNTERVAKLIEDGAKKVDGVDVKLMRLDNIDLDYLNESKAVIFGTPTYLANTTWEVKKWFDEDSKKVNLAGKLGAVFATCDYICGGPDVAILTVVGHLMVKGMLVYSGGGSLGKPFIH